MRLFIRMMSIHRALIHYQCIPLQRVLIDYACSRPADCIPIVLWIVLLHARSLTHPLGCDLWERRAVCAYLPTGAAMMALVVSGLSCGGHPSPSRAMAWGWLPAPRHIQESKRAVNMGTRLSYVLILFSDCRRASFCLDGVWRCGSLSSSASEQLLLPWLCRSSLRIAMPLVSQLVER